MKSESARRLALERSLGHLARSGIFFDHNAACRRGLGNLARQIFIDRNAAGWSRFGMPKADRDKIKAAARPFLRESIGWVRKARNALLAGDIERYELLLLRACLAHARAREECFRPYANKYGAGLVKIAERSADGARKRRKLTDQQLAELEGVIRGCLNRGEPTRTYSKTWAANSRISADTLERIIKKVRAER